MVAVLTEIISILTGGLTGMASGIGTGITAFVEKMFLNVSESGAYSLNVTGGIIAVFAGISLAVSLGRLVWRMLTSLGARK